MLSKRAWIIGGVAIFVAYGVGHAVGHASGFADGHRSARQFYEAKAAPREPDIHEKVKWTCLLPVGYRVVVDTPDRKPSYMYLVSGPEDVGPRLLNFGVDLVVVQDPYDTETSFAQGRLVKVRMDGLDIEGWVRRGDLRPFDR